MTPPFRLIGRGGAYARVADPAWSDPLESSFSTVRGGRWNAPGTFPVLYLNRTLGAARANVRAKLAGSPYGPEDLEEADAPVLVWTAVPEERHVDLVTAAGCRAAGLPETYPRLDDGETVPWERCRPVGAAAWDAGLPGIACRSAAATAGPEDEELAWFDRGEPVLAVERRQPFGDWFWPP